MLNAGNTAIVVDASYRYTPLVARLIPGFKTAMTWTDTITHSPRRASCVGFEGKNCGRTLPRLVSTDLVIDRFINGVGR